MDTDGLHALSRFGLGFRPGEPVPRDPRGWLADQLDAPDPMLARPGPSTAQGLLAMRADREQPVPPGQMPRIKQLWGDELTLLMGNLIDTDMPFRERLVWFWANHFTVSLKRGEVLPVLGPYLREAIRPHVTGRFADMLRAVMTHPAMLMYLDNAGSVGPDSPAGLRRHVGLNENLARECLELHTVSPASRYTQADVTAFAALLTGWSFDPKQAVPGFAFHPNAHEPGPRIVMGQTFAPGMQGGLDALAWLGDHPATHRHLATKLVRHFVADTPPPAAVHRVEVVLRQTHGNLLAASLAVTACPEAWRPLAKLRTPFDYVPAVLRATGVRPDKPLAPSQWMALLGQPPFTAPLPNGWSDVAADWTAGETMLRRVDWAWAISGKASALDPGDLAEACLGPLCPPDLRAAIRHAASRREGLTLLLTAPAFQRR